MVKIATKSILFLKNIILFFCKGFLHILPTPGNFSALSLCNSTKNFQVLGKESPFVLWQFPLWKHDCRFCAGILPVHPFLKMNFCSIKLRKCANEKPIDAPHLRVRCEELSKTWISSIDRSLNHTRSSFLQHCHHPLYIHRAVPADWLAAHPHAHK